MLYAKTYIFSTLLRGLWKGKNAVSDWRREAGVFDLAVVPHIFTKDIHCEQLCGIPGRWQQERSWCICARHMKRKSMEPDSQRAELASIQVRDGSMRIVTMFPCLLVPSYTSQPVCHSSCIQSILYTLYTSLLCTRLTKLTRCTMI